MAAPKKAAAKPAGQKPAASRPLNPYRGESQEAVVVLGGKSYPLVLSMNALVEIEQGMGVPLAELGRALTAPSMLQVRTMIGALVRGGGAEDMSDQDVGRFPLNMVKSMAAIEACFKAAGMFDPNAEADTGPQM